MNALLPPLLSNATTLTRDQVHTMEQRLEDVMELTDTAQVKELLRREEKAFAADGSDLQALRLGIIYHEVALNLSLLQKTTFTGYAQKSFALLTRLHDARTTDLVLMPFVDAYRASALALVVAETRKLGRLGEAFAMFKTAVDEYAEVSSLPEFLRGSVAENLPWFFFSKRKAAAQDFTSIIRKYEMSNAYAAPRIMSFTYWAWANQHQGRGDRAQTLAYLETAIALDPQGIGGREKALALMAKLRA